MHVSFTSQQLQFVSSSNLLATRCPALDISFKQRLVTIGSSKILSCMRLRVLGQSERVDFYATRRSGASIKFSVVPLASWGSRYAMRWKTEKQWILTGFIAAAIILAFVGWESYRDTIRTAEAAAARKHIFEIQLTLDETATRLVDAETGQQG